MPDPRDATPSAPVSVNDSDMIQITPKAIGVAQIASGDVVGPTGPRHLGIVFAEEGPRAMRPTLIHLDNAGQVLFLVARLLEQGALVWPNEMGGKA